MPARRRPLGRALAAATLLAALPGLVACSDTAAPSASPSPVARTSLTIVYLADPELPADAKTWTLTCEPTGGDHPDPAGACAALDANGEKAIPAVPEDAACTKIHGGPDTATMSGTWRGQPVDASFNRAGGCELDRWTSLEPLLPKVNR